MFKRANKITALLVAAASVMSIVPAMAADSTSGRLGSKDGTIENAVAYKGGNYVYQGYKSDTDTDAIYYNDGNKDKSLDDLSSSDLNTTYQDKYAFANDGSTQYLVDLTSGSVTDSTTPSDDADTAATKLQTKLKKASRYGDNVVNSQGGTGLDAKTTFNNNVAIADNQVITIPGNKFADNAWYAYDVKTASSDSQKYLVGAAGTTTGHLYGFTDGSGKYLDASYTANVYAYSTKEGKTVKIDNYSNNYDDRDTDSGLLATLAKQPVALTQDKDYIYALVTVAITDTATNAVATGANTVTASTYVNAITGSATTTLRTYVQKISKAQGDQKDDAYLPKTVETYEVGNTNKEFDCGDASDASDAILAAIKYTDNGSSVTNLQSVTQDMVAGTISTNGMVKPIFTINNGDLIAIKEEGTDKIDAVTIKFKKDKLKFKALAPGYKTAIATSTSSSVTPFDLSNKVDAYFVEKDTDDSVDLTSNTNTKGFEAYDIDVDGNLWVVADGKIYEYKSGSMTKMFTVDSSLDAISVYDANSLIAWEDNGNIYTTVNEGSAQTAADAPATTTAAAKVGWDQLATGTWNFYDATGTKVVNNWVNVGGVWYYLKADGVMATGWAQVSGTWYYLKSSGAMATGWVNDNGTWYYLNASGAMLANTTVDGYVLGTSGAWIQ